LAIVNDLAYVATSEGVFIIDVSDPWNPVELSQHFVRHYCSHFAIEGDYIFITDRKGQGVMDVSEPDHPVFVAYHEIPQAVDIEVEGTYVYLSFYSYVSAIRPGIMVLDLSDPANLLEIIQLDFGFHAERMMVRKDRLYYVGEGGVNVVNISKPENPSITSRYQTGGWAVDLSVTDENVYVADRQDGLYIFKIDH
jgi:hypothetical protein